MTCITGVIFCVFFQKSKGKREESEERQTQAKGEGAEKNKQHQQQKDRDQNTIVIIEKKYKNGSYTDFPDVMHSNRKFDVSPG